MSQPFHGGYNEAALKTASGTVTFSGTETILTQANTLNGVWIHSVTLSGTANAGATLQIGGTDAVRTSAVTYKGEAYDLKVENQAITIVGSGSSGTCAYTVTYEWI